MIAAHGTRGYTPTSTTGKQTRHTSVEVPSVGERDSCRSIEGAALLEGQACKVDEPTTKQENTNPVPPPPPQSARARYCCRNDDVTVRQKEETHLVDFPDRFFIPRPLKSLGFELQASMQPNTAAKDGGAESESEASSKARSTYIHTYTYINEYYCSISKYQVTNIHHWRTCWNAETGTTR